MNSRTEDQQQVTYSTPDLSHTQDLPTAPVFSGDPELDFQKIQQYITAVTQEIKIIATQIKQAKQTGEGLKPLQERRFTLLSKAWHLLTDYGNRLNSRSSELYPAMMYADLVGVYRAINTNPKLNPNKKEYEHANFYSALVFAETRFCRASSHLYDVNLTKYTTEFFDQQSTKVKALIDMVREVIESSKDLVEANEELAWEACLKNFVRLDREVSYISKEKKKGSMLIVAPSLFQSMLQQKLPDGKLPIDVDHLNDLRHHHNEEICYWVDRLEKASFSIDTLGPDQLKKCAIDIDQCEKEMAHREMVHNWLEKRLTKSLKQIKKGRAAASADANERIQGLQKLLEQDKELIEATKEKVMATKQKLNLKMFPIKVQGQAQFECATEVERRQTEMLILFAGFAKVDGVDENKKQEAITNIINGVTELGGQRYALIELSRDLETLEIKNKSGPHKHEIAHLKGQIHAHIITVNNLLVQSMQVPGVEQACISSGCNHLVCGPLFGEIKDNFLKSKELKQLKAQTLYTKKERLFDKYLAKLKAATNLQELHDIVHADYIALNGSEVKLGKVETVNGLLDSNKNATSLRSNLGSWFGLKLYSLFKEKKGRSTSEKHMRRLENHLRDLVHSKTSPQEGQMPTLELKVDNNNSGRPLSPNKT